MEARDDIYLASCPMTMTLFITFSFPFFLSFFFSPMTLFIAFFFSFFFLVFLFFSFHCCSGLKPGWDAGQTSESTSTSLALPEQSVQLNVCLSLLLACRLSLRI